MLPEIILITLALAGAGLVKGLIGLGLPLIAIPVMSAFMPVEQAILIMALPSAVVNGWQAAVLSEHRRADFGLYGSLTGIAAGVALGAALFTLLSTRMLAVIMGLWILAYLAIRLLAPTARLGSAGARRLAPWAGFAAGLAQVSTGIPGPVVATYFHAFADHSRQFAFLVSTTFALLGVLQIVAVNVLGLYEARHFALGCVACLPAMVTMVWSGRHADQISEKIINRLIYVVLLVIAGKLLFFTSQVATG